jgi:hypothetical protein
MAVMARRTGRRDSWHARRGWARERPGFRKGGKWAQRKSFENTRDLLGDLLGAKKRGRYKYLAKSQST